MLIAYEGGVNITVNEEYFHSESWQIHLVLKVVVITTIIQKSISGMANNFYLILQA